MGETLSSTITTTSSSSLSHFLLSFETFDGDTVVDTVVVSNAFWAALKGKIFAVLLGQFLATVAFTVLTAIFASQFSKLTSSLSDAVVSALGDDNDDGSNGGADRPQRSAPSSRTTTTIDSEDVLRLLICLTIDVLGTSSELLPLVGELTDVVYAPAAALALRSLFGGSNVVLALEFLEEILPFTDVLPLATICWVADTLLPDSDLARLLRVGNHGPSSSSSEIRTSSKTRTSVDNFVDAEMLRRESKKRED